jgi:hypothetical protein
MATDSDVYGVTVVFHQQGYWSRRYTYKSSVPFKKDDLVVVKNKDFFSLGKVVECSDSYAFKADIEYKNIELKVVKI